MTFARFLAFADAAREADKRLGAEPRDWLCRCVAAAHKLQAGDPAGAAAELDQLLEPLAAGRQPVLPLVLPAQVGELVHPLAAQPAGRRADRVDRVEHVGPTADPDGSAPDVIDLLVRSDADPSELADAFGGIGFPPVGDGRFGSADPARPVRVTVQPS